MTGPLLFTGSRQERADAARDLGMLHTHETHPDTTKLAVLLARSDGVWRGTVQSAEKQIEHFEVESFAELQVKLCAVAMMLAAPLSDDQIWEDAKRNSIIADGSNDE